MNRVDTGYLWYADIIGFPPPPPCQGFLCHGIFTTFDLLKRGKKSFEIGKFSFLFHFIENIPSVAAWLQATYSLCGIHTGYETKVWFCVSLIVMFKWGFFCLKLKFRRFGEWISVTMDTVMNHNLLNLSYSSRL